MFKYSSLFIYPSKKNIYLLFENFVGRSCYYHNHIHYIKLQMNERGQNCSSLKYIILFGDQCFGNDEKFS